MKQILFLSLVVLVGATTLLLVSQKTSANAKVRMVLDISDKSIKGFCIDEVTHDPIIGLDVIVTGPGGPFYSYSHSDGSFNVGSNEMDNNTSYNVLVISRDFATNGGYKGEADVTTPPCGNDCNFTVYVDVECKYFDNPN
jgi:hypothetical protein